MKVEKGCNGGTHSGRKRDFDVQAGEYDRRAGFGDEIARQIADAVIRLIQPRSSDVVIELGAGTGEIGRFLAGGGGRYIGIDASRNMLVHGMERRISDRGLFVVAECDARWPIADRRVRGVFASRSAHLLQVDHLIAELKRVGAGRVCFLMGRTRRVEGDYRDVLRGRMHDELIQRGIQPRDGRSHLRELIDALIAIGAEPIDTVEVVRRTLRGTPMETIQVWRDKPGLAGVDLEKCLHDEVLDRVADWACEHFGDLSRPLDGEDSYVLSGVRLNCPPDLD